MNITGSDTLAMDGRPVADSVKTAARTILHARLGSLRVSGVAELDMHWIASGAPDAGASRILHVRYNAAKHKVTSRLVVVPQAPYPASYAQDMAKLTIGVLALIVNRLATRGTTVDLSRAASGITRDFATLARQASRPHVDQR